MINILEDFQSDSKQRVVLNGQWSSWTDDIPACVQQGSILGPLLFFIYIKDLLNDIKSKCNLFADGTSLFSVVYDIDTSANDFNHDQWMGFSVGTEVSPRFHQTGTGNIIQQEKSCFYSPTCLFY